MAKAVRISDDSGVTIYTFPGNTAELNDEAGQIDDTIFGQDFQSQETGMIAVGFSNNGFYKGFAGYVAKLMKTGSPTAFTGEAFTLVSGKTYKISDVTKNIWSRAGSFTFKDNGVAVSAANIASIDYLLGQVTFASGYTPTTPITGTGSYLPYTQIAAGNAFTLTQQANAVQSSNFVTAQANSGHHTYDYGLKTVTLEISGFYSSTNAFRTALIARSEVIIEINPDGGQLTVARGWFKPASRDQSGDVGDLEEETMNFNLYVPAQDDITTAFKWNVAAGSTLSTAIKKALTAWEAKTKPRIYYLYDGTNGWYGSAVITEISLSGGLEVMNEFQISGQFDGALTAVP